MKRDFWSRIERLACGAGVAVALLAAAVAVNAAEPAESKALDSAGGANKGMFDVRGRPYAPLLERARTVNREVYPLIEFFDARNR